MSFMIVPSHFGIGPKQPASSGLCKWCKGAEANWPSMKTQCAFGSATISCVHVIVQAGVASSVQQPWSVLFIWKSLTAKSLYFTFASFTTIPAFLHLFSAFKGSNHKPFCLLSCVLANYPTVLARIYEQITFKHATTIHNHPQPSTTDKIDSINNHQQPPNTSSKAIKM